jgi:hypothetical protein
MKKYEIHPIRFNVGIHNYSNCCYSGSYIVVEPTAIGSSGAYLGKDPQNPIETDSHYYGRCVGDGSAIKCDVEETEAKEILRGLKRLNDGERTVFAIWHLGHDYEITDHVVKADGSFSVHSSNRYCDIKSLPDEGKDYGGMWFYYTKEKLIEELFKTIRKQYTPIYKEVCKIAKVNNAQYDNVATSVDEKLAKMKKSPSPDEWWAKLPPEPKAAMMAKNK